MTEKNQTPEHVIKAVKSGWGMDIESEDAGKIQMAAKKYLPERTSFYAFGEILCPKYTMDGWCTHGHSGGDVPLHAYGPRAMRQSREQIKSPILMTFCRTRLL
jgi:alkaline phosphatase